MSNGMTRCDPVETKVPGTMCPGWGQILEPSLIGEKCRQQSIMPLIAPKMLAHAPVLQPLKNAENNASIIRSGLASSGKKQRKRWPVSCVFRWSGKR